MRTVSKDKKAVEKSTAGSSEPKRLDDKESLRRTITKDDFFSVISLACLHPTGHLSLCPSCLLVHPTGQLSRLPSC